MIRLVLVGQAMRAWQRWSKLAAPKQAAMWRAWEALESLRRGGRLSGLAIGEEAVARVQGDPPLRLFLKRTGGDTVEVQRIAVSRPRAGG